MGFFLLLLLNAILFIRPAEFIPPLYALPLYEITLAACLVFAFPTILEQFNAHSLAERPITVCVLGLLVVIPLSNLARGQVGQAFDSLDGFFKVVLYYLLMVGILDSPERIRGLLDWMIGCIAVVVGVAVLNHYGYVHIALMQGAVTDDLHRMGSTGLFGDPNDLGVLIAQGIVLTIDRLLNRGRMLLRAVLVGIFALFFYGLQATASRGGMLALLVGLGVYCLARFGRRGLLFAGVVLPVLLVATSGRQGDFDVSGGTGQARIHLWDAYLGFAISNPILGIGHGNSLNYTHHVAHNSFLHGFAELGAPGGVLFVGVFFVAIRSLIRLGKAPTTPPDSGLSRMQPCLLALVVSLVAGMMSLTWTYNIPAYWLLALTVCYVQQAELQAGNAPPFRMGLKLASEMAMAGIGSIVVLFLFVRFNASYY